MESNIRSKKLRAHLSVLGKWNLESLEVFHVSLRYSAVFNLPLDEEWWRCWLMRIVSYEVWLVWVWKRTSFCWFRFSSQWTIVSRHSCELAVKNWLIILVNTYIMLDGSYLNASEHPKRLQDSIFYFLFQIK